MIGFSFRCGCRPLYVCNVDESVGNFIIVTTKILGLFCNVDGGVDNVV